MHEVAQGWQRERPVRIAHNLHSPAHLTVAARRGVPTLLLVREPTDTVLSEAIRESPVSLGRVLSAYIRFYETVAPHLGGMAVGDFSAVTKDFGSVIAHVFTPPERDYYQLERHWSEAKTILRVQ